MKSLEEVARFIESNGHLPNIPSADVVEENGIKVSEMNAKLLEKIEELTLYTIKQEREIEDLKRQNESLETIQSTIDILIEEVQGLKSKK